MRWVALSLLGLLLVAYPAGAQTWRKGLAATDDPVNNQRLQPGGFAYYTVADTSTTDSGILDVSNCPELRITHYKLAATDLSQFDLYTCAEKAKTNCSRICADYGAGIVCPTGAGVGWFNGDDGTDVDGDGTAEGRNKVWYGPERYIYIDIKTAPSAGEDLKAEVLCAAAP